MKEKARTTETNRTTFTKIDDQLVKHHTREEAREAARLRLILHPDVEQGLHKFYATCAIIILTIGFIVALFYYAVATRTVVVFPLLSLLFMLVGEGATLHHFWRYNPITVHRKMLHDHDYGVFLSAIKHSGPQNGIEF